MIFPRHCFQAAFRLLSIVLCAVAVASCETARFYGQAVEGQREINRLARPLAKVEADPATTAELRRKLGLVREVRAFAVDHLGLSPTGQYTRYSDLKREHAVWVVFAAEEFSTEPHRWWYPMIGHVGYRGFFREAPALELAATLEKKGLETYVGGVDAFSTLGWFDDPVLNTFVRRRDCDLAEIIIHELTHQRLYISADTDFNEALATAFAEHGVNRWLAATARHAEQRRYRADTAAQRAFFDLALRTRERLRGIYDASKKLPLAERRALKAAEIARFRQEAMALQQRWPQLRGLRRWFEEPVTNARLNTIAAYYELVPAFERLLEKNGGDADAFFREVKAISRLPKQARRAALMPPEAAEH